MRGKPGPFGIIELSGPNGAGFPVPVRREPGQAGGWRRGDPGPPWGTSLSPDKVPAVTAWLRLTLLGTGAMNSPRYPPPGCCSATAADGS